MSVVPIRYGRLDSSERADPHRDGRPRIKSGGCPGHPRLYHTNGRKTWMPATSAQTPAPQRTPLLDIFVTTRLHYR
jgi:hypothetical protein